MREYTVREYDKEDYDIARDSMTVTDVVHILVDIALGHIPNYFFTGDEEDFKNYKMQMAIYKAIEIIETKQTEEG